MSAKWIRSKQWDDQHIPSWAWPVKFVLRALSSIPLAIVLLGCVVAYAILASVPIGLLVLGLTNAVQVLSIVAVVGAAAVIPVAAMRLLWRPAAPGPRAARFALTLVLGIGLIAIGWQVWHGVVWPRMIYDPANHTGFRLFAGFVEKYRSTTLRRLPGFEMSELEFYSWWPLRVILSLFVINMIVATVRRIEFTFPNIGVLTVHTGIVTIALGSMYYKGLKQEGDTLLIAGEPGGDGAMTAGPPQDGFYDNTRVVLWARETDKWEQRPIHAPRYNEYNLSAGGGVSASDILGTGNPPGLDGGRTLDRPVLPARGQPTLVDPDISFRIVGYASYANPTPVWVEATEPAAGGKATPARFIQLVGKQPRTVDGQERTPMWPFFFVPDSPAQRVSENREFAIEYSRGMPAQRWADLSADLPAGTAHALVVEIPAAGDKPGGGAFRAVYPVKTGDEIKVGETGYTLTVKDLADQPPFPIITAGYRDAQSSVAIVRVVPPGAKVGPDGKAAGFDRWVYHRFPEISQDLLDELNDRGMPKRRDADPAIRISYIDASKVQIYLDEQADGSVKSLVRMPAGAAKLGRAAAGARLTDIIPMLDIQLAERWTSARQVERPVIVPEKDRDRGQIGTHDRAMLAVEVSAGKAGQTPFKQVVWLPFTKYLASGLGTERTVDLPDGRHLALAFGRLRYTLPGFMIQLADFQMIAYDHRGAPRDYQSLIRVSPLANIKNPPKFEGYEHVTKLNAPLQAPFMWSDKRPYLANVFGTLASRLSPRQFKFSQAGWDSRTWQETQKLVDQGRLPRPYVTFTILGVGNNPGIHIVALGAILMSVGIPWAFYVKPLILKARKRRLKAQVAAGTYEKPARPSTADAPTSPDSQPVGVQP